MIWLNCILGCLIFKAIACLPAVSHGKSIRSPRSDQGGVVDKDPNDVKYLDLAKLSMIKYGKETHHGYMVLQVTRATEQVVSGLLTKIDFYVTPTSCPSPNCQATNPYNIMSCHSSILEQPWLHNREISVGCYPTSSN